MEIIVALSTIFQFAAGFFALKLIAETRRNWAWIFLASGIFAMAFRRTHSLYEIYQSGNVPTIPYEILGLAISILLFAGVFLISPLIRDMQMSAERIAESEERYRTVAEFTHDWEYWLTPDGKFVYVSPACERITGFTPREFMEEPDLFDSIIHPEYREEFAKRNASLAKLQKPSSHDLKIMDKSGHEHWIAHNSMPVYSRDGRFLGVRASIRLIDHRKNLEASLRDSRALYENLVQNSPCLVFRLTSTGQISFANKCALEHFGYAEDELTGVHVNEILINEITPHSMEILEQINQSFSSGQRIEVEIEHVRRDGMRFWGEWVNSAILDEFGEIKEFVCVGIDVTKRKALDKLKEDVSRIVRHDLKSPLSGIIGIPRILRKDSNITPRQAELLQSVEDAGTIMLELINRSLQLYKLETGTYVFDFKEFDLVTLLRDVVRHINIGKGDGAPIKLTIDGRSIEEGRAVLVSGERALVFSMFGNLVKNAVEASRDEPVLINVEEGEACITHIHNAGVVPEKIREKFFEKYVTEGKSGGTGLGTFSAYLIAEKHGGSITMSSSEQSGTILTVSLPWKYPSA